MQILEPFQIDRFIVKKFFIFFLELNRMPFLDKFCVKKKVSIFWKKSWTNHANLRALKDCYCSSLKRLHFLSTTSQITFWRSILHKNNTWKNVIFFDKKHALTPLEKYKFASFYSFYRLKTFRFLSRTLPNTFSRTVFH